MKLSPQETQIIDYLNDGEWHCMASGTFFMKDDRARISALKKKGYVIDGEPCDSRAKCPKNHHSSVLMRKLIQAPKPEISPSLALSRRIQAELEATLG